MGLKLRPTHIRSAVPSSPDGLYRLLSHGNTVLDGLNTPTVQMISPFWTVPGPFGTGQFKILGIGSPKLYRLVLAHVLKDYYFYSYLCIMVL